MFTGIIEEIGLVQRIRKGAAAVLTVAAPQVTRELRIGDSISVNGVCLTVSERDGASFTAEISPETLSRSNLGALEAGQPVNLERALRAGDRLGGHWVSGHIDAVGQIARIVREENSLRITFQAPPEVLRYVVVKGSIAVDGISLTVASCDEQGFSAAVIPLTARATTLGKKRVGDSVNLEGDLLGKYVEKFLTQGQAAEPAAGRISQELLARYGFMERG
ncbi:MAG: riboflavin synthase [Candidatus Tectomicrobia bacterium]|uniref:Riboflavin synthase n=1 Tax=Tectimicrobiota bacterium TaxID=2528274 RepID=A0A932CN16_UNCTE|nr:riboflavin synthase [Candidatus Tectomicrobia bacterium]